MQFGVPLYGATLLGQIVYPVGNKNGCEPFAKQLQGRDPALPVILLVSRGDCYFVEKVHSTRHPTLLSLSEPRRHITAALVLASLRACCKQSNRSYSTPSQRFCP